jgi:hypothetical protein
MPCRINAYAGLGNIKQSADAVVPIKQSAAFAGLKHFTTCCRTLLLNRWCSLTKRCQRLFTATPRGPGWGRSLARSQVGRGPPRPPTRSAYGIDDELHPHLTEELLVNALPPPRVGHQEHHLIKNNEWLKITQKIYSDNIFKRVMHRR